MEQRGKDGLTKEEVVFYEAPSEIANAVVVMADTNQTKCKLIATIRVL